MRRTLGGVLVLVTVVVAFVSAQGALAGGVDDRAEGTIDVGADYNGGKPLPLVGVQEGARVEAPGLAAEIGEVVPWLALDDAQGFIYAKDYTLRGKGDHIEVWVASGVGDVLEEPGDESNALEFLPGDCRNGPRTEITDEQVSYLISQFDQNIYPKESSVFSVPPDRDGSNSQLLGGGIGATGAGDDIVVLIDNVRDDNFYDVNNSQNLSYIAGFFFSVFNELLDRNVMTIDGWDWLHRTGATPPDEPVPGDLCTTAPARPFLYEGVFAHEYQHLLEYYEDPGELNWVNEGLSDWAQTLTGYVTPSTPITESGFDSHTQCFLGYLGIQTPANPNPREGGPENSLTNWGDQGDGEILCDYGAAYTTMEFLAGRYGPGFMSALHRGDGHGFAGLADALAGVGVATTPADIVHDWAVMAALDGHFDEGARLFGGGAATFQTPTLHASINWDTQHAYSTPGAPPNGSDYVRLRDGGGKYLKSVQIRSLEFDGAETLPPKPVEWAVDPSPPAGPDGLGCGQAGATIPDPALFSDCASNLDRTIVVEVTVPAANPTLTFDTLFQTEELFDYGFVQVSTDGGLSYQSLGNAITTSDVDPTAVPAVQQNLPGLNGDSGGWITTSFDLSAYTGQTILIAFRYVTDSSVDGAGWWIDDVLIGDQPLTDGSSLDGWRTPTEIQPLPVSGYTVQLVAYSTRALFGHPVFPVFVYRLPLDAEFKGELTRLDVVRRLGPLANVVAAIVTYDDPSEAGTQYAPYSLTVNGVVQPGGS